MCGAPSTPFFWHGLSNTSGEFSCFVYQQRTSQQITREKGRKKNKQREWRDISKWTWDNGISAGSAFRQLDKQTHSSVKESLANSSGCCSAQSHVFSLLLFVLFLTSIEYITKQIKTNLTISPDDNEITIKVQLPYSFHEKLVQRFNMILSQFFFSLFRVSWD